MSSGHSEPTGDSSARLYVAAALSGASVMVVELTATRLFAPWFGASIYAWTNVVAVVLGALAAGYFVGGRAADRSPNRKTLGKVLLAASALTALAGAAGPMVAAALAPGGVGDPAAHVVSLVFGSAVASLAVFGPPLFLLGFTTPFVTRLVADGGRPSGSAAGGALAVSTVGSLVGCYLPAFLLLDLVGSRGTIFVAAGMLAVAAFVAGGAPDRRPGLAALSVIVCAFGATAFAPFVPAEPGESSARDFESAYQYVRVSERAGPGGRRFKDLSLDEGRSEFHSRRAVDGGLLTDAYYDVLAVVPDWISDAEKEPVDVLVIGGGAGTLRGILRGLQGGRVRSVIDIELDPEVSNLAPEFGGAAAAPDRILNADGRSALRALPGPFDYVVLDAYARQLAIPAHLGTKEAFAEIRAKLTPRGVFAVNVSVADLDSPLAAAVRRTLHEAGFAAVAAVPVAGSWNAAILAGPLADPRRVVVSRGDALDPTRFAFRRSLFSLGPPPADAELLTDDRAPLERLARRIR